MSNLVIQKKPNLLLYFIGEIYFKVYCALHAKLKVTGDKPKGPALILSNHTSNEDYKYVVCAAFPHRISFLVTYHFFTFKKLSFWLKAIGAIPKYQFTSDLESMKKIRYVVQNNKGLVYIAPEGTVYANGKLGYISPSIAKMIKFLKVPVYASNICGAGLGMAKWSKHRHNINYVSIDTKLIISAEEAVSLDKDEIMRRINTSLSYNEFDYQKKNNVLSDEKNLAEGFETVFYKCPVCGEEFKLSTLGNKISCSACGATAHIQKDFTFKWEGNKQYFENYIQWYDWQYDCLKNEISKPDFEMKEEMDYGIDIPGINNYVKVGHGVLTFNHDGWTYEGTKNSENVVEHDEIRDVFLATLKVGLHFELPFKYEHCRVFFPENGNRAMKWHLASRVMTELINK